MKIKVSDNKEQVEKINRLLKENEEKYGKKYCPCVIPSLYESENNQDYVCMCKEFRELKKGECHCGLYVKVET